MIVWYLYDSVDERPMLWYDSMIQIWSSCSYRMMWRREFLSGHGRCMCQNHPPSEPFLLWQMQTPENFVFRSGRGKLIWNQLNFKMKSLLWSQCCRRQWRPKGWKQFQWTWKIIGNDDDDFGKNNAIWDGGSTAPAKLLIPHRTQIYLKTLERKKRFQNRG